MNACRLVSIIIPCFNQGHFLAEAIGSVLAQTYPHWECIVINDGSSDDTERIAGDFGRQDSRVRVLTQSNRGLAHTRNRGLDEARGAFIQFLDADDLLLPSKLAVQLEALAACEEPGAAYCHYRFGESDDIYRQPLTAMPLRSRLKSSHTLKDLAENWETELSIPIHCYLFDARLFAASRLRFDTELPNHEDWECWMRLLANDPPLVYIDQPLVVYRTNTSSMCRDLRAMRRGFLQAIKKQQRLFAHDPEIANILKAKLRATRRSYREHSGLGRARAQTRRLLLEVPRSLVHAWVPRGREPRGQ